MTSAPPVHSAAYVPTGLADISRSLAGMFSEMEGERSEEQRATYLRAAQCNAVFLLSSPCRASAIHETIERLAIIHPSRFFVLVEDESAVVPRAEVCAQCHLIPRPSGEKPEHLCSEIIRVHFKRSDLRKVAGILRANLVSGASAELFFFDPALNSELASEFLPLADQLYFNSAMYDDDPTLLARIASTNIRVVDIQWLGTAAWRDQLRAIFESPELIPLARGISKIEVGYCRVGKSAKPFLPLLIAGWFVDKLNLEVLGRSGEFFDCHAPHGGAVRLSIIEQELDQKFSSEEARTALLTSISIAGIIREGKKRR